MMKSINVILIGVLITGIVLLSGCVQEGSKTTENYCKNLSLLEAKQIALSSECIREGNLKETSFCNEVTGTWWIDMDIKKGGCNPACVINVETKTAEINWRCTGLIKPPSDKEDFCGTSTNGECSSDSDCKVGGCSGQVCQSKNEKSTITTCEWRDCYNSKKYGLNCKCVDNKCQWS